jgi:hypothetical protein
MPQETYYDEGFEDFRDFANFIDGVGLSAQWTPEYNFDWLRFGDQYQESRRHSQEPDPPEDIGTPFSTWLPSAPAAADDQVHLRSQSSDGMLTMFFLALIFLWVRVFRIVVTRFPKRTRYCSFYFLYILTTKFQIC